MLIQTIQVQYSEHTETRHFWLVLYQLPGFYRMGTSVSSALKLQLPLLTKADPASHEFHGI